MTLPSSTIRYRKPTRRQEALMAMGISVTLKEIQEPIRKAYTAHRPKHTQKLTRRQRLLPSGWVSAPYVRPVRVQESIVQVEPPLEVAAAPLAMLETPVQKLPRLLREPRTPKDRTKEEEERRIRLAKIIKVSYEVWQQLIQADEKEIEEQKRLEKVRRKELATQERIAKRRGRRKRYYQEFYGPSWFPVQAQAMARSGGICEICKANKAVHV